ncbi:MAG TPA: DMT family transporter [Symbiobacteriaceae bacterium]|nr:DMT family transporter [Symbiobacteriaceae bacterium]
MNKQILGYIYAVMSALLFASATLFMKKIFAAGMSVWDYSVAHSLAVLVTLVGLRLAQRRPLRREAFRKHRRAIPGLMVTGFIASTAFNVALSQLSISLGTILLFTYPAFVTLIAWAFLRHRPDRLHLVALVLALMGTLFTVGAGGDLAVGFTWLGAGLALLSAVSHASYLHISEHVGGEFDAISLSILTRIAVVVGSASIAPHALLSMWHAPWQAWAILAVSSIVGGVLPFLLLFKALDQIGANQVGIASVTELPFALLLGLLFEGESVTPWQGVGAVAVLGAVLLSQLRPSASGEQELI